MTIEELTRAVVAIGDRLDRHIDSAAVQAAQNDLQLAADVVDITYQSCMEVINNV